MWLALTLERKVLRKVFHLHSQVPAQDWEWECFLYSVRYWAYNEVSSSKTTAHNWGLGTTHEAMMFRDEQTTAERVQSRLWSFLTCFIGVHLKSGLLVFIALLILNWTARKNEINRCEHWIFAHFETNLLFDTKALQKKQDLTDD